MIAKFNVGNQMATGILIGAVGLFSFAFLRAEDMFVSLSCLIAVLGWVGWWYERSGGGNKPLAGAGNPDFEETIQEVENDVVEAAHQIMTARVEAEQAVNTAVASFGGLVEQANSLTTISKEILHWQEALNPLYQPTIELLGNMSTKLQTSVNQLVMAFQFNDLLSQRLTHTENSLNHINARLRGEETTGVKKSMSFAEGPVEYNATEAGDDQVTLF